MWSAANFIFTTLYNMIMMLTIMSFFFLGFCFLEMEKIKPVYAPKDFFEVHIIIAETTYEQRTGFTQSWKVLEFHFPWKFLKLQGKSLKSPWIFFDFGYSDLESVFLNFF